MINIDHIHKLHQEYQGQVTSDYPRCIGKTTYISTLITGCLQVLHNELIVLVVSEGNRIKDNVRNLQMVLESQGLRISEWDKVNNTIRFLNSTSRLRILTELDITFYRKLDGFKGVIFIDGPFNNWQTLEIINQRKIN